MNRIEQFYMRNIPARMHLNTRSNIVRTPIRTTKAPRMTIAILAIQRYRTGKLPKASSLGSLGRFDEPSCWPGWSLIVTLMSIFYTTEISLNLNCLKIKYDFIQVALFSALASFAFFMYYLSVISHGVSHKS